MSTGINSVTELSAMAEHACASRGESGFREAVEAALSQSCPLISGNAVISDKFLQQTKNDPSLAEEISRKISQMMTSYGNSKDNIIIVDRRGEIAQYDLSRDKKKDYPDRDELREIEKERLRRKARLDAYFKIVQQNSIKRKLIEEENVRRPIAKRYRCPGTDFDSIARSILQKPNRTNEFYF